MTGTACGGCSEIIGMKHEDPLTLLRGSSGGILPSLCKKDVVKQRHRALL